MDRSSSKSYIVIVVTVMTVMMIDQGDEMMIGQGVGVMIEMMIEMMIGQGMRVDIVRRVVLIC